MHHAFRVLMAVFLLSMPSTMSAQTPSFYEMEFWVYENRFDRLQSIYIIKAELQSERIAKKTVEEGHESWANEYLHRPRLFGTKEEDGLACYLYSGLDVHTNTDRPAYLANCYSGAYEILMYVVDADLKTATSLSNSLVNFEEPELPEYYRLVRYQLHY